MTLPLTGSRLRSPTVVASSVNWVPAAWRRAERDPVLVTLARSWPATARFRADPRFAEIVSPLELPRWNAMT